MVYCEGGTSAAAAAAEATLPIAGASLDASCAVAVTGTSGWVGAADTVTTVPTGVTDDHVGVTGNGPSDEPTPPAMPAAGSAVAFAGPADRRHRGCRDGRRDGDAAGAQRDEGGDSNDGAAMAAAAGRLLGGVTG